MTPDPQSVPEVAVTMIGASGCGKTMYLYGMYTELSAGLEGYFLFSEDLDLDQEMAEAWDELCDTGTLPPPTPNVPRTYPFVFRTGIETVLRFSWEDYRGGAMSDHSDDESSPDVVQLRERLLASGSIYLVIEGFHLARPVTRETFAQVRRVTFARKMTTLLQHTIHHRQLADLPLPSVVVLVTKADLIARANPGQPAASLMEMVADSVKQLLPVCFSDSVSTLVCPVQIGNFPDQRQTSVDPSAVSPRNLQQPMIFTFLHQIFSHHSSVENTVVDLRGRNEADTRTAARLDQGMWNQMFRRGERVRVENVVQARSDEISRLAKHLTRTQTQIERLQGDLEKAARDHKVMLFDGGVQC
jgi:hypothetical protein